MGILENLCAPPELPSSSACTQAFHFASVSALRLASSESMSVIKSLRASSFMLMHSA